MRDKAVWLVFLLFISAVPCAARKERAPLQPQILAAKTVYIENHGNAKLKDKAYEEFRKWGRWEIVEGSWKGRPCYFAFLQRGPYLHRPDADL